MSTSVGVRKLSDCSALPSQAALTMESIKLKKAAYVQVVEQPAGKGLRFRYECEGRSAGSIPGASSTQDNRTFPTIKVVGYRGRAVVVVSCVSLEHPYRPHPHNLVGKEGCKKGVCTLELGEDMTCSFPSLGIQCVKKKDIEESLALRHQIRVDPFQTGFGHKTNPSAVDLNCVRLAFQVFLEGNDPGAFTFALKPVVSDPIYDKKSKCDLTICRLTETSASVAGGKEILLFCDKITKDDIQVRFYEENGSELIWEGFGEFQPADVHKQYGICFKTPKYKNIEIESPVQVSLQLRRTSDGAVSESRPFEFLPLDVGRSYWSSKRLKTNFTVFNQILSVDQALQAEDLRHKTPLPRSDFMSISSPRPYSPDNIKEEAPSSGSCGMRQQLNPVAMPGTLASGSRLSQTMMMSSPSVPMSSMREPVPKVPMRSPHKSSLLHQSSIPVVPGQYNMLDQVGPSPPGRPMSDLSLLSDFTHCDTASVTTRQSVNEILSLAEVPACSEDTVNLDSLYLDYYLQDQGVIKQEDEPMVVAKSSPTMSKPSAHYMGSVTSVNTVRELMPVSDQATREFPSTHHMVNELEINQIYDDVMQCVYDDVDTKYDNVVLMDSQEPPVPPMRKRGLSVDRGIADLNKPLPVTPKNPSIITKLSEKKNELIKEREKELEKKRQQDELRKKEKELLEEQRRKEKEEKEKKRLEEKEKKRQEEEQKRIKKKHEEEEKKSLKQSELETEKYNQSLFQRLFQRTQSRLEDEGVESPPPVPAHSNLVLASDEDSVPSPLSFDTDMADIEQLISQAGDLQRLDSVVQDFTTQFPTDNNNSSKLTSVPSM